MAWAVLVAAVTAGPLLLAARLWVAGALLTALGAALAIVTARALHGLSERWAVLVPAGLVLHDPMTVTDPFLLPPRRHRAPRARPPRRAPRGRR